MSSAESNADESSSGYSSSAVIQPLSSDLESRTIGHEKLLTENDDNSSVEEAKETMMEYLGLVKIGKTFKKKTTPPSKSFSSYNRYLSIPLTSKIGQFIIKNGAVKLDEPTTNKKAEVVPPERKSLRCETSTTNTKAEEKHEEFPITFKKDKALKQMPHQFCFNSRQRKLRMQTIDRGKYISIQ